MNKRQFEDKYVGEYKAVLCKTEELAKEFLDLANSFGYDERTWENSKYYMYKTETCYLVETGRYCDIDFYRREGYLVVEFESQPKKLLLHRMMDLFMKEWELEFNEVFKANWSDSCLYKIDTDYKLYNEYVTVDKDVFCEIENRTFVYLGHIVKMPKKVKYVLEIEQEEFTSCCDCPLSFMDSELPNEDERRCTVTYDLVGFKSIPDNCPLKKYACNN